MAFMGRGGTSFGGGIGGGIHSPNNNNDTRPTRTYYRGGLIRMYYFIPLDNTYVIFQMIATFLLLIIAVVTLLITYKSPVVDPIAHTKKIMINTYIAITISIMALIVLANYYSKNKISLIKKLLAILFISLITLVTFIGIKVNTDVTYTKAKFEQIYVEENRDDSNDSKTKFAMSLNGMKMETKKEYYADECLKAYKVFSIRMFAIFGINIFVLFLLIYQIIKVSKLQDKREQLEKNDAILFDEEQNCRY